MSEPGPKLGDATPERPPLEVEDFDADVRNHRGSAMILVRLRDGRRFALLVRHELATAAALRLHVAANAIRRAEDPDADLRDEARDREVIRRHRREERKT